MDTLLDFVNINRDELIRRCRDKVALRFESSMVPAAIDHGVPLFLQQLADTLLAEESTPATVNVATEATPAASEIGRAAALHGAELLRQGYTIDQVVHDYGDVCQAVTDLAVEHEADITAVEFRTLNRCLDDAIADAVTAFGSARQTVINEQAEGLHQRLLAYEDEQRRLIEVAMHAYSAIRTGQLGPGGATGVLLLHALEELRLLSERLIPEIRLASAAASLS